MELALVSVPLLGVSLGAIDLGLILWTQSALQGVAADAARCGAVKGTACSNSNTISSFVRTEAANWVLGSLLSSTSSPLTVNVSNSTTSNATCPAISVTSATFETVQIETSFFANNLLPPPFGIGSYTIDVCASFAIPPSS
ncbi:MAG TPA: TadE family protein [Acetobacteraceae bacterium]|nr:TadE family protein [Acetobacteraceae bacterium]